MPIRFNKGISKNAMQARTVYGITPNDQGRYVLVSLHMGKRMRLSVRRWNVGDKLQDLRLLHRGVYCGVPSFWKSASSPAVPDMLAAPGPDKGFIPWTDRTAAAVHTEALSNNLLALVPEDSYLCTVPFLCGDPSLHSFISVHAVPANQDQQAYFKIAVIVNKTLIAVFALAPGAFDALEFHLGRIRRFFGRCLQHVVFPEHVYVLGIENTFSSAHFLTHPLPTKIGHSTIHAEDELKALGCALAQYAGTVPVFAGPSKAGSSRHFRAAAWIAAFIILLATAFAACVPTLMNVFLRRELAVYGEQYHSVVINNPVITAAVARNDSLGASILKMNAKSRQRTNWGRFLQALGSERPEGLFYEKLGSETAGALSNAVRIAISGFAQGETRVTDLIARLQKTGLIANISLTSMEKNKTKPNICDFKIVCTLITGNQ
jgi:hypothetical protein